MAFATGVWGEQAKKRSKKRLTYFRAYSRMKRPPKKVFRLGRFGEMLSEKILIGSVFVDKSTHDIEWNGKKIEVKTTETISYEKNNPPKYVFDIHQQMGKTDYFLLICLEKERHEIKDMFLIPDEIIRTYGLLRIGVKRSPKYDRFRMHLK